MLVAHVHVWEPMAILGSPARSCFKCGVWEQISKKRFKKMFGYLLWQECKHQIAVQRGKANGILTVSEVPDQGTV